MNDHLLFAKKIKEKSGRSRVLLIMPPDIAPAVQPHLGLGLLADRLKSIDYNVLVVDYSYLASLSSNLPNIEDILTVYSPNVIGVSLFSQYLHLSRRFIELLHQKLPHTPIVIGGPHVSLGSDKVVSEILQWPGVRTIVTGEAEADIVRIINNILDNTSENVVNCVPVTMSDYRRPDFDCFIDGTELETYPIQLSRGCPYACVFCNIEKLAGRKFRKRNIADSIEEIKEASRKYTKLRYIKVTDDAPNCDADRFEAFIEQYIAKGFKAQLEVMQLRADHLTEKSCKLLKKAGQPFACIGVESADSEVLRRVNKGETLEHIERACGYIKASDLPLVLCFVLGLPWATWKSDLKSVKFASKAKPVHCYWNIAQPMPGTKMYDYFLCNGTIYSENTFNESSTQGNCLADTPEYSKLDRVKMRLIAQATTNELKKGSVKGLLLEAIHFGVFWHVLKGVLTTRPNIPGNIPRRW